ncbi:MAG: CDP-alcohol phosphatidyltransferase family protein [Candidatus Acidiferrales bacterium]
MTPNQVTLARVAAAFAAVALFTLFGNSLAGDLAAVLLTISAIALDGLDGYLARTRNLATPLGAQLDILGDRVVENLFFTFFAVSGLISLWVPVLFFVRGTLTDFLRSLASRAGCPILPEVREGWGLCDQERQPRASVWVRTLVASRASRAAYAILKCVCFCYLGLLLPAAHITASWLTADSRHTLTVAGQILVAATVGFCVLRAIPVIWEGRRYLTATPQKTPARIAVQATR